MDHLVSLNSVFKRLVALHTILKSGDGTRLEEWLDGFHITLEGILIVLEYQFTLEMKQTVKEHQSLLRLRLL